MARKILLADDSVTAQNMGRKILADAGYEVITVNNGSAALKRIGEHRPDVIVLDVYMPGYSGLEVCQRLKETGETSRIPILLTVGKLEPFKPEEAKRVRADGFIVKPFEASELLSALTRLEDKIVPSNEPAKPGRFARLSTRDEGRFDKTMAIEEDAGWKNRIAFPSKKEKEPAPEEPVAVRPEKDAPPPVEHVPANPRSTQGREEKFDLGALATSGLPKDVTPEEIAALAAAAARMKGKVSGTQEPEPEMPVIAPLEASSVADTSSLAASNATNIPKADAGTLARSETGTQAVIEKEKNESPTLAAEENLVPEAVTTAISPSSQASESASEPVTMAVAAAVGESSSRASRWTAVSVALEPDDSAISLEQEMQRAYAAFAAAETGHSSAITAESINASAGSVPETPVPVPAIVAPEAAQTLSAVASAATEAVSAAVQELEKVANSYAVQNAEAHVISSDTQVPAPVSEIAKVESPVAVTSSVADESVASSAATASESSLPEVARLTPSALDQQVTVEKTHSVPEPQLAAAAPTAAPEAHTSKERPTSSEQAVAEATAAMAATVGGRPVEETSSDADPAIASIVDSVLANLRPKIVEEISRKLGKR